MKNVFVALLVSVILSSCAGHTSFTDKPISATPSSKEIDIVNENQIHGRYSIIGVVYGSNIKELKQEARKLGADAISAPIYRDFSLVSDAIKYK